MALADGKWNKIVYGKSSVKIIKISLKKIIKIEILLNENNQHSIDVMK